MQVEKTTKITLDEKAYEVSDLSAEVQQMVAYLDDWRQKEVDLTSDLLMVRGALRDIQNALVVQIQEDQRKVNGVGDGEESAPQAVEPKKPAKKVKKVTK